MKVLNVGIVGAGRMASIHARNLASLADVSVSFVLTPDGGSAAAELSHAVGARLLTAWDEHALAQVDALVVASPSTAHEEAVERAIEHGLPLFLEKPLAADLETSGRIARTLASAGACCQVGLMRRYDPDLVDAVTRVRAGEIGRVVRIVSISRDREAPAASFSAHSGGLFVDMGVHDLDMVRWIAGGELETVFATRSTIGSDPAQGGVDEREGTAVVGLRDGSEALIAWSRAAAYGYDVRCEIWGTDGALQVGLPAHAGVRLLHGGFARNACPAGFAERFATAYRAEIVAFIETVRSGGLPSPGPDEALWAERAAHAAARSAQTGRPERVAAAS